MPSVPEFELEEAQLKQQQLQDRLARDEQSIQQDMARIQNRSSSSKSQFPGGTAAGPEDLRERRSSSAFSIPRRFKPGRTQYDPDRRQGQGRPNQRYP